MSFDPVSYAMGSASGKDKVEISGSVTCTDDGEGNITITEEAAESGN